MKILINLTIVATLMGCSVNVTSTDIAESIRLCKEFGGVRFIDVLPPEHRVTVFCVDGNKQFTFPYTPLNNR
jgi:hypothetical protein